MTKDTDPIVTMGRELARVVKAHNETDESWVKLPKDSCEKHRHLRNLKALEDRQHALEHMILTGKARSAEGAMVQVMVAGSWVETLTDCPDHTNREKIMERCVGALSSAFVALEELTGLKREEIGGTYYAFRELDCFAEDLAAA